MAVYVTLFTVLLSAAFGFIISAFCGIFNLIFINLGFIFSL